MKDLLVIWFIGSLLMTNYAVKSTIEECGTIDSKYATEIMEESIYWPFAFAAVIGNDIEPAKERCVFLDNKLANKGDS